jgi:Meckel syndrome type 1 protein
VAAAPEPVAVPATAVVAARKPASRVPLYAGIALAAVTVLALGGWIWTRPPVEAPVPAVAVEPAPAMPAADPVPPESLPAPVAAVETAAEAPAPEVSAPPVVPAARPPAAAATPARTPSPTVRPAPVAPEVIAPPPVAAAPLIVIAPAPGPAPTAAEPRSTDPDAPIATRPQPIG